MNAFKRRCVELRKQDYTLPEIVEITGRPKTSVHFHIRDIPLSAEKQRMIREIRRAMISRIVEKKRGKSARAFRKFVRWNNDSVFAVSHFVFDGELRRGCMYNNRNMPLIRRMQKSVATIYDFKPRYYQNSLTGVHRICYFNVAFGAYIKQKSEELLRKILHLPKELKREFVRSFFDDEGCMDFRQKQNLRRIRGYQKKVDVLYLVHDLLRDFDIVSSVRRPNEIVITGRDNLLTFKREIDFSPGVRINGDRSNSIWKRSLEKRLLLRRAIASYKPVGSNGVHRAEHDRSRLNGIN